MALSFNDAREHPELRQEFLDGIDLEWARPYIRSVRYVPQPRDESGLGAPIMGAIHALRTKLGLSRGKSVIRVYDAAFDERVHRTADDFFSSLIDHEGTHARDLYLHPELLVSKTPFEHLARHAETRYIDEYAAVFRERLKYLLERRASGAQLSSGRSLSPAFRDDTELSHDFARQQERILRPIFRRVRGKRRSFLMNVFYMFKEEMEPES